MSQLSSTILHKVTYSKKEDFKKEDFKKKDFKEEDCKNVNAVKQDEDEWTCVEVTVDSGAYDNVCSKDLLPELGVRETEASKNKEFFCVIKKKPRNWRLHC